MKDSIFVLLKGLFVGGSMLVPGVSGGSMAMILGIYDKLVAAVSTFFQSVKKNLLFLGLFCIGGGLGMVLFAKPLLRLIERFPMPTLYFFLGAVAGSIPMILKKAEVRQVKPLLFVYPLIGLACIFLLELLPVNLFQVEDGSGAAAYLLLGAAGFLTAIALVLPGISVSYMLLVLGMYDQTMKAISSLYFPYLIPLGVGLLAGTLLTTKLLDKAMTKHPQPTYLIIFGFLLASIADVFPGVPSGWNWLFCLIAFAAGMTGIWFLSRKA